MAIPSHATDWNRNEWLSNYAINYASAIDPKSRFGYFIAPIVPVKTSHGYYSFHEPGDTFQVVDTRRAKGQATNLTQPTKRTKWFDTQSRGLGFELDTEDIRKSDPDDVTADKQANIDDLIIKTFISYDMEVKRKLEAAVPVTTQVYDYANETLITNLGNWTNGSVDPLVQLKAVGLRVKAQTNWWANRLAMTRATWEKMAQNPLLRQRITYNSIDELTPDLLIRGLNMQGILLAENILIISDTYNKALPGGDMDPSFILDNDVYFFYSQDVPNRKDVSFAKTFNTNGTDYLGGVQELLIPERHVQKTEILWEDDTKVTSPLSGIRFTVS